MSADSPNISRAQLAPPQSAPRAVVRLVAGRGFIVTEQGEHWATGIAPSLIDTGPEVLRAVLREGCTGERVFAWGLAAEDGAPGFWGRAAWERLEAAITEVLPALADARARLLLRPRHDQTLADVPGALRLLNGPLGERLGLILDPVAMLAPSMLASASDHFRRTFEALGARADAIVLSNIAAVPGAGGPDDERLAPAPLRAGLIDPQTLLALAAEFVPETTLRVYLDGDRDGPRVTGGADR